MRLIKPGEQAADVLARVPSVTRLMQTPDMLELERRVGHGSAVAFARAGQAGVRRELLEAASSGGTCASAEAVLKRAVELARQAAAQEAARATAPRTRLHPVINATGIVLNTNLGRAPLSREAADAVREVATGYSTLAVDELTGRRADRNLVVRGVLSQLTGAQSALVVNNNAAATLLVVNTLAKGKDVVVSRGELVEIGGAFRLPDVIVSAGARLVEVGTTNRTHLKDYRAAVGPTTGLILKVHRSNYRIVGFTAEVDIRHLVALGREAGVPVADDIGSGAILDTGSLGLAPEPGFARSVRAGADVVFASGDKLLGGPQCGIVVGRSDLIEAMHDNPLYRCLRVDKMTLAALEVTLRAYREYQARRGRGEAPDSESAGDAESGALPPGLRLLCRAEEELESQAHALASAVRAVAEDAGVQVAVERTESFAGSGSLAGESLASFAVSLCPSAARTEAGGAVVAIARALRTAEPPLVPVYPRVQKGKVLMDMRAVFPEQVESAAATVRRALQCFAASRRGGAVVDDES